MKTKITKEVYCETNFKFKKTETRYYECVNFPELYIKKDSRGTWVIKCNIEHLNTLIGGRVLCSGGVADAKREANTLLNQILVASKYLSE